MTDPLFIIALFIFSVMLHIVEWFLIIHYHDKYINYRNLYFEIKRPPDPKMEALEEDLHKLEARR